MPIFNVGRDFHTCRWWCYQRRKACIVRYFDWYIFNNCGWSQLLSCTCWCKGNRSTLVKFYLLNDQSLLAVVYVLFFLLFLCWSTFLSFNFWMELWFVNVKIARLNIIVEYNLNYLNARLIFPIFHRYTVLSFAILALPLSAILIMVNQVQSLMHDKFFII